MSQQPHPSTVRPGPAPRPQAQAQAPTPAPAPAATTYRRALRVAGAIAGIKWVVIVLLTLAELIAAGWVLVNLQQGSFEGNDLGPGLILLGVLGSVLVLLLAVLLVWVLFGWFEHMLRVLVAVADHTHR